MTEQKSRHRIVLCRGQYCNMDRRADKLHKQLEALLAEVNGDAYPPPIKLTTANCLSMCGAGPNCIIYPENEAHNALDAEKIAALVRRLRET